MTTRKSYPKSTRRREKPAAKKRRTKKTTIPAREREALERELMGARDRLGSMLLVMLDGMDAALTGRRKATEAIELSRRIADAEASLRTRTVRR